MTTPILATCVVGPLEHPSSPCIEVKIVERAMSPPGFVWVLTLDTFQLLLVHDSQLTIHKPSTPT